MSVLDPALDAALSSVSPTVFGAIRVHLPSATICLLDGAGQLSFGGYDYAGSDPTYGTIAAIETLSEGMGDTAPALAITFFPPSDAAAADMSSPAHQGSLIHIHAGAINPATGAVIGVHELMTLEIDVPTLRADKGTRSLEIEAVSVFQRLFTDDEGIRLSPDFHKDVWPGETGLDDMSSVPQTDYWGAEAPSVPIYSYPGGGGGTPYETGPVYQP
ncbi:MAG: hypothetical protein ABW043_16735 [Devosia sp.]|uniref:hypothetical protein n=1 Tax=Devosia sp. TaxID=1871048 RepID=UPI003396F0CF